MTNRKMIDYRVRIQVAEDSPDGVLLDFLKHERHPSFSHKEMVLWALRGYWMAIAFRQRSELEGGTVSEVRVQRIVQDSIHQLNQQITYLQSTSEMGLNSTTDEAMLPRQEEKAFAGQPAATRLVLAWDEGEDLFDSRI
jgi:hypothetical protein